MGGRRLRRCLVVIRPAPTVQPQVGQDLLELIPRLLTAYLAPRAKLCGPPATDRKFHTIGFLTWLDLKARGVAEARRRGRFRPCSPVTSCLRPCLVESQPA